MKTTISKTEIKRPLPVNRYHKGDSPVGVAIDLSKVTPPALRKILGINEAVARQIIARGRKEPIGNAPALGNRKGVTKRAADALRRCALGATDTRFAITNVRPAKNYLWSYRPLDLCIDIVNPGGRPLALATVRVFWKGQPFVVEKELTGRDRTNGSILIRFNEEQTLPPGPARFVVDVYDAEGGKSSFKRTCVVLPSNPLSLSIAPRTYYVTGSYSLRGNYDSSADTYVTDLYVNIYNGNSSAVTINRTGQWEFWDGGVGGTLVESGSVSWSASITIAAYGTWTGTIRFTSPRGSGVYNRYDDKEDMTLKIQMSSTSGVTLSDTLTCRVMLGYGLDIIRVASDTFVGQEYTDLYDAVEVTQSIYEARDITIRDTGRYHIDDGDAGSYGTINSEDECRDMFSDWSAASGGSNVDVFVCHDFSGTGFDGLAGDIPGPTSHSGRKSGVGLDKTGYVDASGTRRLSVDYLGMLIGHEVGHYLGLSHLSVAGNLMHPSSGTYDTDLTYDQYRDMLDFGWLSIV